MVDGPAGAHLDPGQGVEAVAVAHPGVHGEDDGVGGGDGGGGQAGAAGSSLDLDLDLVPRLPGGDLEGLGGHRAVGDAGRAGGDG